MPRLINKINDQKGTNYQIEDRYFRKEEPLMEINYLMTTTISGEKCW
jgi:hypothetical protein